jgi:hypothetical protein
VVEYVTTYKASRMLDEATLRVRGEVRRRLATKHAASCLELSFPIRSHRFEDAKACRIDVEDDAKDAIGNGFHRDSDCPLLGVGTSQSPTGILARRNFHFAYSHATRGTETVAHELLASAENFERLCPV